MIDDSYVATKVLATLLLFNVNIKITILLDYHHHITNHNNLQRY